MGSYEAPPGDLSGALREVRTFLVALAIVVVLGIVLTFVMFTAVEAGEQVIKALSALGP